MAVQPKPLGTSWVPVFSTMCAKHERYMVVAPVDVSTNNAESHVQPGMRELIP